MKPSLHNKIKMETRIRSVRKHNARQEKDYKEFFSEQVEGVKNKRFKPELLPSLIKRKEKI